MLTLTKINSLYKTVAELRVLISGDTDQWGDESTTEHSYKARDGEAGVNEVFVNTPLAIESI